MNKDPNAERRLKLRLSWQANCLYTITSFIAFATSFPRTDIPLGTSLSLALALAAVVGLTVQAVAFINDYLLPKLHTANQLIFLIEVALIGVARGYAFFYLVESLGLEQPTPLPIRVLTSTINTLIWLSFSCALIEGTATYSRQFSKLFKASTVAVALRSPLGSGGEVDVDSLDNLVALKQNLKDILDRASDSELRPEALLAAGAAVRSQIEKLIKPLSHRLWFNEKRNRTEIRLLGLIRDSLITFNFSAPRVLSVWGLLAFASILNAYSLGRVIFGVALSVAMLAATITGYQALSANFKKRTGTGLTALFLIFIAFVPVSVADLLMPAFGQERMLFPISAATLVSPIALIVLFVTESSLALVEEDRKLVKKLFEDQIKGMSVEQRKSSFAGYLHNSLQSELTGIAYRLEASAAEPNAVTSRETLEKLGAVINRSIGEDFANFEETPLERLGRMIEAWDGIAKVTAHIPEDCRQDLATLNLAVQVIEEATTNSVRYGKAKELTAVLSKTESGLRIEVKTDARNNEAQSTGLGTQWLDAHSIYLSPLSLTSTGTMFTIEI